MYSRLARSIAPEIWGHEDVKKVTGGSDCCCWLPEVRLAPGALHLWHCSQPDTYLLRFTSYDAPLGIWPSCAVCVGGVQALLLVLVGGVTKEMDDGMRLRGDIHACLMGAQAVAVVICLLQAYLGCQPGEPSHALV